VSRSRAIFLACVLVIISLWIGLLLPFDSWPDVLLRPWHVLWGSGQQLNATLLEASGNDSVRTMGQELLKPFGTVKLLREVDTEPKTKS